jgi:hypothetical protein
MGLITLPCDTPSQATIMSDSDNETGPFDAHHKREQLHREVFQPMLSVLQKTSQTHLPIPKRQRNLYGYNFSPPSTPNGNHTIAEREAARKAARIAIAAENDYSTEFTPRCLMKQCIAEQKTLVQACVNVTDADWNLMASFLSPAKPPLHPSTKSNIHPRPCRIVFPTCLCISCAGLKAKATCTPCLVCGALIPYSVCLKSSGAMSCPYHCLTNSCLGAQSPLPTMCFKCSCAFRGEWVD